MCEGIGHPEWADDEAYATNAQRLQHKQQLASAMTEILTNALAGQILGQRVRALFSTTI
jgi:crotonobetainyl-CoA:carnitine CoA-transferase CaiB-like acyl-CoA transferase